jgi:hypothetical protein
MIMMGRGVRGGGQAEPGPDRTHHIAFKGHITSLIEALLHRKVLQLRKDASHSLPSSSGSRTLFLNGTTQARARC